MSAPKQMNLFGAAAEEKAAVPIINPDGSVKGSTVIAKATVPTTTTVIRTAVITACSVTATGALAIPYSPSL